MWHQTHFCVFNDLHLCFFSQIDLVLWNSFIFIESITVHQDFFSLEDDDQYFIFSQNHQKIFSLECRFEKFFFIFSRELLFCYFDQTTSFFFKFCFDEGILSMNKIFFWEQIFVLRKSFLKFSLSTEEDESSSFQSSNRSKIFIPIWSDRLKKRFRSIKTDQFARSFTAS